MLSSKFKSAAALLLAAILLAASPLRAETGDVGSGDTQDGVAPQAPGAPNEAAATKQAAAKDDDPRGLVKRVLDSAPDVPSLSSMRLTTPGGLERYFTVEAKPLPQEDDLDGRYIEVTDPYNLKGIRYLFYERTLTEDEQYVYMPSMPRAIRLSETSRREPFLSSTFYIIDMVEPALDDFTYKFIGDEEVGGRSCRLVESLPKDAEKEYYGRTTFAIDPKDLIVMRTELFDSKGKLMKVLTVEKIEKIDDWWTPLMQRMDHKQDETTSELETVQIKYRVPISDDVFNLSHMLR